MRDSQRTSALFLFAGAMMSLPALVTGQAQHAQPDAGSAPKTGTASRADVTRYEHEHLQTDPNVYVRYTRPGQCVGAAFRAREFYWRDKRTDTMRVSATSDSAPAVVIEVAKACAARFSLENTPVRDLPSLVNLYLWTNQPELAKQATARLFRETTTLPAERRAWMTHTLVTAYFLSMPRRLAEIRSLTARLDSMGAPGANAALLVRVMTANMSYERNDIEGTMQEAEAGIRAGGLMSKDERADDVADLSHAYGTLADGNLLHGGTAAGLAVVERAPPDLLSTRPPGSPQAMMIQNWINGYKQFYPHYDKRVVAIEARHWFNKSDSTATYPRAGKVTLVYFAEPSCGGGCYPTNELIHRLHKDYGDRLDIVLVGKTNGFFRMQLQENTATEVELIRNYFIDFLKLPVTLAVSETQFARSVDGRRFGEPSANQRQWPMPMDVVLVGKDLKVKYLTSNYVAVLRETLLRGQIDKALQ